VDATIPNTYLSQDRVTQFTETLMLFLIDLS